MANLDSCSLLYALLQYCIVLDKQRVLAARHMVISVGS